MVGWWSGRELRALLERHGEELAAVWPAFRDSGVPRAPSPGVAAGLVALTRAAGRSATHRSGTGASPEHAVALLALALLHRVQPAATPAGLRPLVDAAARVDAPAMKTAGVMSIRYSELVDDPNTPSFLVPWCLDATLLCATRWLDGSAPDDPLRTNWHQILAHTAAQRFERDGDSGDEETAIIHARAAFQHSAGVIPRAERASLALWAARLLAERAGRLRDPTLLENAPDLVRTALSWTDPSSAEWLDYAMQATVTFIAATAREKKNIELLDEALELQRAVRRHPQYHRIERGTDAAYAGLLAQRFARRRDLDVLDEAIGIFEQLYAERPQRYAADLGRHLEYRYQLRGGSADRRRGLDLMEEGLSGPYTSAEAVASYGVAAVQELRESGDPEAINRALEVVNRLTGPGCTYADDFKSLRARAQLLLARADMADAPDFGPAEAAARDALENAISVFDRGLGLALLATVLVHRYRFDHDLAVLDEAVACCRNGLAGLPGDSEAEESHQLRAALVMALTERHTRTRHLASLEEAVEAMEQVVEHMQISDAETPVMLVNVTTVLTQYARETKESAPLDRAQHLVERALADTPPGHSWHVQLVSALGSVLVARARLPGAGIEDADTAVHHLEAALRDAPADSLSRAGMYSNLSGALHERHRHGGDREDLDTALAAARKAVRLMPPGHPLRYYPLAAVSSALSEIARADESHDAVRDQALAVNAELAADPALPPAYRVVAALRLATVAHATGDFERALTAVRAAIETLPLVVWRGVDRSDQEQTLRDMELGSLSAQIALAAGRPRDALELLEAGRGILAVQALELRTDAEDLAAAAPELAARFTEVRQALERAADDLSTSGADRRHRLAREWQEALDAIRAGDGFADFLRPPRTGQLLPAGAHGPVVVVTVGKEGDGHALLLDGTDLTVCPLPGLTHREARERSELLFAAAAAAGRSAVARGFAEQHVGGLLDWLWSTVAEPVLDALGITGPPPPGQEPPRLWWCPCGPLSFLPLHAAGAVPDRVVSSYTPSLTALLRARGRAVPVEREPLIVAVPETAGQTPLPGAVREAQFAHRAVGGTLLHGDAARGDAVRDALGRHSWVHFACHGIQDPEQPSEGRLLLPDSALSVLDMTRRHLPDAEFAYLSACETAVGGSRLPDEALHLAGSLQLAGFSQVIGTLWRVDDASSAEIAERVYGELAAAAPGAPPAALALHHAVRNLRDRHPDHPLSWAAHVHSGA
jgi:tetratricopeptide (TPR) repeat protein